MASHRMFLFCTRNISPSLLRLATTKNQQILPIIPPSVTIGCRNYNKSLFPYVSELYRRRLKVGPEKERHRSEWINWNYDAEIYAFGKRLGEEFSEDTLRIIFTDKSYIEKDKARRQELGVDEDVVSLELVDNGEMAAEGNLIASRYIKAFLRFSYPAMFEEGICAIHDFLMSEDILASTGLHIGMKDLTLTAEFPVLSSTMATAFLAAIGGLAQDQGVRRAERFVNHFILPHLIDKDINDLWPIDNPMGLLKSILLQNKRGPPEPRLIHQSASQTIMSLYWVAIYGDKEMIGKAPGETVTIAEEMASRECLRQLMKTSLQQKPLLLGPAAEGLQLDYNRVNPSIQSLEQTPEKQKALA
ncbi:39S ribosomal protein L44, mitochondrial [Octopus bimaculoides]|nr:39S ribosomal protein L44, mitochondrial [Octopus bimaculoides]